MNATAATAFDVLGLGCAAVDDMLFVPTYPEPDKKTRVQRSVRRCGGLTGAALVTAARLGARCAYAGCLGPDPYSKHVSRNFTSEGVDISHAPRLPEARVVHSVIVAGMDVGSRNIFYEDGGMVGAHPALPAADVIRGSKVLLIDHLGMEGNLRAAREARSAGRAVVADFEDQSHALFPEVLDEVDHLILCEDFALALAKRSTAAEAALALWNPSRSVVIVTTGCSGCWSVDVSTSKEARHHTSFPVEAKDTTGCGDVFHGAYAAKLARGESLEARIRFASAAAALKAMSGEIPGSAAVQKFLASRTIPQEAIQK